MDISNDMLDLALKIHNKGWADFTHDDWSTLGILLFHDGAEKYGTPRELILKANDLVDKCKDGTEYIAEICSMVGLE